MIKFPSQWNHMGGRWYGLIESIIIHNLLIARKKKSTHRLKWLNEVMLLCHELCLMKIYRSINL